MILSACTELLVDEAVGSMQVSQICLKLRYSYAILHTPVGSFCDWAARQIWKKIAKQELVKYLQGPFKKWFRHLKVFHKPLNSPNSPLMLKGELFSFPDPSYGVLLPSDPPFALSLVLLHLSRSWFSSINQQKAFFYWIGFLWGKDRISP